MALSQGAINSARSGAGELNNLAGNLKTACGALKEVIRNNGNYQYFKLGTDKGTSVDTNINVAVDTIVDKLAPEISNLASAINSFCTKQEVLNRQEALDKIKNEELERKRVQYGSVLNNGKVTRQLW